MKPEVAIGRFEIFAQGLDHPEGLAFDREGFLWAGGEAGQIYRIGRDGSQEVIATLGGFCAGLAFSPTEELFVCNVPLGVVRVRRSGGSSDFAARIGNHNIVCANFPVFDSRGNLYVSDSGEWNKKNGCLLRFDPQGNGQIIGGPYGYCNGLALDAEERHLFMVESDSRKVYRFVIARNGSLGSPETFVNNVGRMPDGVALDSEGNLYVCCYASDEIYRVTPGGKKRLFAFDPNAILLSHPTNLAFSGEHIYVANFGRQTITRARIARFGQPLANFIGRSFHRDVKIR